MFAFFDLLNDLGDERFEIAGIAARHDALIGDDRLVDPVRPGVDHVCLDGVARRCLTAANGVGLYQQPGRVADGGDDFAFCEMP